MGEVKRKLDIKRVLWVDDNPDIDANKIFFDKDVEIDEVKYMKDAIERFSGPHLYEYDAIVLDIDFAENGFPNGTLEYVRDKLKEKIYLSEKDSNNEYLEKNGGYLLYLYLLEKGYPSDRIAFYTGNAAMIDQLKLYTELTSMTKEEIAEEIECIWNKFSDENEDDRKDKLLDEIKEWTNLPEECRDLIWDEVLNEEFEITNLKKKVLNLELGRETAEVQNTGDKIIFKFHEVNLKEPAYFSKLDGSIPGHNRSDAKAWLDSRRTEENITRWLLLNMASYVEKQYSDENNMSGQVGSLFVGREDPGLRNSFRQMFFVFDGIRSVEHRGIYYQAVSAMLIPFDTNIKDYQEKRELKATANCRYDDVRAMFTLLSKQARNYCAHNYCGSTLTNGSVIYFIMAASLAILTETRRKPVDLWYEKALKMFENRYSNSNYNVDENIKKIDDLLPALLSKTDAGEYAKIGKDISDFAPHDKLRYLGWNIKMSKEVTNSGLREKYFIFTLAAYVVEWFDHMSETDVEKKFGKGVNIMYRISNMIVAEYEYREE